jgi:ABC-type xylose transport system permease subunit
MHVDDEDAYNLVLQESFIAVMAFSMLLEEKQE